MEPQPPPPPMAPWKLCRRNHLGCPSPTLPFTHPQTIYRFDILLDKNLKPWLIEVNHAPSFTTDSPLD